MGKSEFDIGELLDQHQSLTGIALAIGTVESATGGGISNRLTDVPGISQYLRGSIVSYSNIVKIGLAGVTEDTIRQHGAVSAQTAEQMAEGGKKLMSLDICVSDTGIAGPAGGTVNKPVGLFYMGLSAYDTLENRKHQFQGDRRQIREQAIEASLVFLKKYLDTRIAKLQTGRYTNKHVVTCFLENTGKILIVQRSKKVGTYRGSWSGISGYLDTQDDIKQAYAEIREETGLNSGDIELVNHGAHLDLIDEALSTRWIVHPFLFHVLTPEKIELDWENLQLKWIYPNELNNYLTVPGLAVAFARVSS